MAEIPTLNGEEPVEGESELPTVAPLAPPPPFAQPAPFPPPYPRSNTNGTAITALVLGILGITSCGPFLGVPAIILARKAKREIAASGGYQNGDGLALGGQILGWVSIALWVVMGLAFAAIITLGVLYGSDGTREPSVEYLPGGNCFDGPPDLAVGLIDPLSCTYYHDNEIFAALPIERPESWNNASTADALQQECEERFRTFAGRPLAEPFDVSVIIAPPGSWKSDPYGLCVVTDRSGGRQGTMEAEAD